MAEHIDWEKFAPGIDFAQVEHVKLVTACDVEQEQIYLDRPTRPLIGLVFASGETVTFTTVEEVELDG